MWAGSGLSRRAVGSAGGKDRHRERDRERTGEMEKDALSFLKTLMETPSPSGFEQRIQGVIRERLARFSHDVRTDVHGNVIARLNAGATPRVMIAGHCDEIGFLVQHISDEGYIYVQPVGGIDISLMPGRRVHIHTARERVLGVIGKKPVHLMDEEDRKKIPKVYELWVDIGAKNKKEASRKVEIGDPVTLAEGFALLNGDIAVSRSFDDKIGAFVVVEAFGRLSRLASIPAEVSAVSTVQEEIGLRGARTSAFGIDPHVGVAVDVGFASDHPTVEKKIVGDVRLGRGPILHKGANINPVVGRLLIETAKKRRIPFQLAAEPRASGTDANAIQISRAGVAAGLVSIPNRYMHTPVEMVSLKDVEAAIRLLVEFVKALSPDMDFTPVGQSA
jgi:putative aminopeptidase FrvX